MLTGTCYEPVEPPVAGVVIAPAMAVEQTFYRPLAEYLAVKGYRVWTFDYRGIGQSRKGSMRACHASISSWINADFDVLVKQACVDMAGLPLYVLGHSLGGLITPLLPSIGSISGIVNVAIGSGATRHLQPRLKRAMPLLWHVLSPVLCPVFGYFPGSKLGVLGDIPRKAMYQWRRWCLNSEYLLDGEPGARAAYASVRCPVLGLFISDDELLLDEGSRFMHYAFSGTKVDYRVIGPAETSNHRVGHFGFFKQRHEHTLWPMVSQWLEQQTFAGRN